MKRLYLDISVIGGAIDTEFKEWSIPLIDAILDGKFVGVISELTVQEILRAPKSVIARLDQLTELPCEIIALSSEVTALAELYIQEKVLTRKSIEDAQHIALAALSNVTALVSWNFKHLVNIDRIRMINSVNLKHGYRLIDIRSTREILGL